MFHIPYIQTIWKVLVGNLTRCMHFTWQPLVQSGVPVKNRTMTNYKSMGMGVAQWETGTRVLLQATSCSGCLIFWQKCVLTLMACWDNVAWWHTGWTSMFSVPYKAGAFLTEEECSFISTRCYASLAEVMFRATKHWCFPLYPKLHIFHHIMLGVKFKGESAHTCCNPMMFGTQMDEDVVGETSSLSRRVNIRKT